MSFIQIIDEEDADGPLAEIYEKIAGARGGVANVLKIHSLNAKSMAAHFDLYKVVQFGRSALSRPLREMIGVVVSAANHCSYCIAHHSEPLYGYRIDKTFVQAIGRGELPTGVVSDAEFALLEYAQHITLSPGADASAIERLRAAGWNDAAILDATLVAAYFNFVNRIVESLGVELEADFKSTCEPDLTVR